MTKLDITNRGSYLNFMILTIIVTYNGEKYIEDCLASLQSQTHQTDILVVDNDSVDQTCEIIEKNYPQVKVLKLGYNSGFAHANNVGIQYAMEQGYEYVLLINEDTVADQYLIQELLRYADNKTAVIPQIYMNGSKTKVWYAAGKLDFEKCRAINCQENLKNKVTEVTFMTGCCMFIHMDVLREVGLFDEKFFMYYEDTDLSLRMYKHQIRMLYVPDTYVWHRLQGRTRKPYYAYYMTRNKLYFLKKHAGVFQRSIYRLAFDEVFRIIFRPDAYTKAFAKYQLKGIWDFLKKRMGRVDISLTNRRGLIMQTYRQAEKHRIYYELTYEWMNAVITGRSIADWIVKNGYRTVAIYGMSESGQMVYWDLCKCRDLQVRYGLDRRSNIESKELKIYNIDSCPEPVELIIVTAVIAFEGIKSEISEKLDFSCKVISLIQLIEEMYI